MNAVEPNKVKYRKNVFITFENKRATDFEGLNNALCACASRGIYFDKISKVAFDNSEEIVRAVKDGVAAYENIVLYYPVGMDKTIKDFVSALFNAQFDALGMLTCDSATVFTLFSDSVNRLTFDDIKNTLDKKYGVSFDKSVVKIVCAPHDLLERAINGAQNILRSALTAKEAYINVDESYGDCKIELVYSDKTPKMAVDGAVREVVSILNDYVYALEDVTLCEQLFRLLKLRRMKLSVAESFTGGGISKRLVDVSGISEVYFEGMNTYSNQSKTERLGVNEFTLRQHGAVSAEVAREMAEGLLRTGNCDIAVSTTGIAGPKSDNTNKPVGLAYIGVGCANSDVLVYKFNFVGDRHSITQTAINQALFLAYKELK